MWLALYGLLHASAMKTRLQKAKEDRLAITRRNTQSKKLTKGGENTELIPIELITEILSRLPEKSVARFRCVSKLWASTLVLPYFTEFFLTRSSDFPQLLFAFECNREVFFFSSPQPQNLEQSSHVGARYHLKIPYTYGSEKFSATRGLVFHRDESILNENEHKVPMIYSTRQSLTLPKLKTRRMTEEDFGVKSYLGYDPLDKQYKVLSMTYAQKVMAVSKEHQVLTLGTGNPSWRRIKCCVPHFPVHDDICINGVLYYQAISMSSFDPIIICFDVRSETFRFIKLQESFITYMGDYPPLINYDGKLGLLIVFSERYHVFSGTSKSIELRVLQNVENQEWSEHIYVLPALWHNMVGDGRLVFVGVTRKNEIVLSPYYPTEPFYVFYYNTERNTIKRVWILGMEAFKGIRNNRVHTYLDHVENVKLL